MILAGLLVLAVTLVLVFSPQKKPRARFPYLGQGAEEGMRAGMEALQMMGKLQDLARQNLDSEDLVRSARELAESEDQESREQLRLEEDWQSQSYAEGNESQFEEGSDQGDDSSGFSEEQAAAQRRFEAALQRRATRRLDQMLGPGRASVRVSAELDFDRGRAGAGFPGQAAEAPGTLRRLDVAVVVEGLEGGQEESVKAWVAEALPLDESRGDTVAVENLSYGEAE